MYTREEIEELSRKFEESRKKYDKSSKELQELSEQLKSSTSKELYEKDKEHRNLFGKMLKDKKNYNDACWKNFKEKYDVMEDETEKEILKKRFIDKIDNADSENYGDWDDIMDELDLW
ncbi:MAG: hypothetical protein IK004_08010 [Bacteroidales bacterium]|nr:hypothetical protein [Bacteroidales bacterium]